MKIHHLRNATMLDAVDRLRPDVVVAPAGAANFGFGRDILFSVDELVELGNHTPGEVVLNHLEALDHCPTNRRDLGDRITSEGLDARVHIPDDGNELSFELPDSPVHPAPNTGAVRRTGFQKWLTAKFAGT